MARALCGRSAPRGADAATLGTRPTGGRPLLARPRSRAIHSGTGRPRRVRGARAPSECRRRPRRNGRAARPALGARVAGRAPGAAGTARVGRPRERRAHIGERSRARAVHQAHSQAARRCGLVQRLALPPAAIVVHIHALARPPCRASAGQLRGRAVPHSRCRRESARVAAQFMPGATRHRSRLSHTLLVQGHARRPARSSRSWA